MTRLTKTLSIALAASFALNVFLVGFWAGRFVRGSGIGPSGREVPSLRAPTGADSGARGAMGPMGPMGPMPRLGEIWRRHGAMLDHPREQVEGARRGVRDALLAEPFQVDALEAALSRLRTDTDAAQVAFHRSLVTMVRDMTPEERHAIAQSRWFAGLERRGGGGMRDPR